MKKFIPFGFLIILSHFCHSSSTCLESVIGLSGRGMDIHQVLLLKGADCINCYRAGKIAHDRRFLKPEIVLVRDIPKRFINDFLMESLNIDPDSVKIIYNDSLWACLNIYMTSAVVYVKGGNVDRIMELKSLLSSVESPGIKLIDSMDLTLYYGGSEAVLRPKGNNLVIYNEFKHQILEYDPKQNKPVYSFKASGKDYLSIDSLGKLIPNVDPWRVSYTNNLINQGERILTKNASIGAPYVTDGYIYVPLSISIVDTSSITNPKKREDVMYPYCLFAKYDFNWNLKQLLGFRYRTIDQCDTFFNSLSEGYFENDSTFFMMMSTRKKDSLFSVFHTDTSYHYDPVSFLNVKYPDKLPRYSKFGHLQQYVTLFSSKKGVDQFYLFALDNELNSLNGTKHIKLKDIPDNNLSKDSINSFIHALKEDGSYLYVLYSSPRTEAHLNKYDAHTFDLVSTTPIYSGKITKMFFWGENVCVLKTNDESAILYRYSIK